MLNTLQEFLERQKDFHTNVKHIMLRDLNEKAGKHGTWKYDDGFFYLTVNEPRCMVIIKTEFEPYVFDTMAVLPEKGWPTESTIYRTEDIHILMEDLINETIDEQEETNELENEEKPAL